MKAKIKNLPDEEEEEGGDTSREEKKAPIINVSLEDDDDGEDNLANNLLMGSRDSAGQPASVFIKKAKNYGETLGVSEDHVDKLVNEVRESTVNLNMT